MALPRALVTIASPALRAANNGNWHTAHRWARFLRQRFSVELCQDWTPAQSSPDCLIALHARRSAAAIAAYARAWPQRPRVVVLTGTDLYRDLPQDPTALRSLELATRLVVLQEAALDALGCAHRAKCAVIHQSAPVLAPAMPRKHCFEVVLVGHMRAEKDPLTPMRALLELPARSRVRLRHIGAALEEMYAAAAQQLMAHPWPTLARYRWMGAREHAETRQHIRRAHALLISSLMEGGANVIVEALACGVPVLASRVPGNVGMLGADYDGYFPVGDARALAELLERASNDPSFLAHLQHQCAARAPRFDPVRERASVDALVAGALADAHAGQSPTAPARSPHPT
jgi:putative glycosyltransferase (TIGR04348 family)